MRQIIPFSAWVAAGSLAGALLGLLVMPPRSTVSSGDGAGAFSPALSQRLQEAGAASGDVQIALLWNSTSWLELSCVDPAGQTLSRKNAKVASGGKFDFADKNPPPESVANLYWSRGASKGRYQVFVAREGEAEKDGPTTFTVAVKTRGRVEEFSGVLHAGSESSPVYEFVYEVPWPLSLWNGLWTALVTTGAALGLFIAQARLPDRPPLSLWTVPFGASVMLAAGLIGGAFSFVLYLDADYGVLPAAWGLSWAVLGGLLCWLAAPRLGRQRMVLCGILSGAFGFLIFQAVAEFSAERAGRLWCAGVQGGCLGAAFALVRPAFGLRLRPRDSLRVASEFSLRLATGQIIPLTKLLRLTNSDLPGLKPRFLRRAVAQVRPKPGAPGILGLTNLSRNSWSVEMPSGVRSKVLPGQAIRLERGARIGFGRTSGDIL